MFHIASEASRRRFELENKVLCVYFMKFVGSFITKLDLFIWIRSCRIITLFTPVRSRLCISGILKWAKLLFSMVINPFYVSKLLVNQILEL